MTEPICTSHWCLVMSFCLKVCIYSHTRGVKLGLGLGFMQTSQVLPHWLNQSFSFWTLSYTQRHCHVRIEKSPNCCYNIRSTQFPRISLYALTLRFVLIEITKVVIRRGANTFGNIVYLEYRHMSKWSTAQTDVTLKAGSFLINSHHLHWSLSHRSHICVDSCSNDGILTAKIHITAHVTHLYNPESCLIHSWLIIDESLALLCFCEAEAICAV